MVELRNDILSVGIDETHGADVVSLRYARENREFAHRSGLQSWIKSGTRVDPASDVLSNFYGGVASPEFELLENDGCSARFAAALDDIVITKVVKLRENVLDVALTIENVSSEKPLRLQVENFCNLAGAKFAERGKTSIFLLKNGIPSEISRLEKFAQRYVKPYEHDGESIVIANADWNSHLRISSSDDAERIALVIHANRLCWGLNMPKLDLPLGEKYSFSLKFEIAERNAFDVFPELAKNIVAGKPREPGGSAATELDSLFSGEPVFKERWSHLCLQYDRTDPDDLRRIIADVLAPMRYTGVVFELDRGVRLESHPELAADFALPINEVIEVAGFARDHGLKVGVEFNTPGHQNETGIPDAHPDLMEPKPANIPGHVLCVSNPATRRLVQDIWHELIEAFEPDMTHFGADEVQFEGYKGSVFGYCEHSKGMRPEDIFGEYIEWLVGLAVPGSQSAIFGDMFLKSAQFGSVVGGNGSEGDLWRAITRVPRDTVILDWHYYPAEEYKSLDYFKDLGFDAWAVTAFSYEGIRDFLGYAEKIGLDKTMHTTWSVPNPEKLFVETMVWAACHHWLGARADDAPVRELALRFAREFWD